MTGKVAHPFRHSVIKARVDEKTRTQFRRMARSAGKTESELLREIIAIVIEQQIPGKPDQAVPIPAHTYPDQLTLRLPSFLLNVIRERTRGNAQIAGKPCTWFYPCLPMSIRNPAGRHPVHLQGKSSISTNMPLSCTPTAAIPTAILS